MADPRLEASERPRSGGAGREYWRLANALSIRHTSLMCSTLLALLLLAACVPSAAQPMAIDLTCDDFQQAHSASGNGQISKEVAVPVGMSFLVTLCSNPGTGFQWEGAKITDAAVVQQTDRRSTAPATPRPGAPNTETWTFKALKTGTSTIAVAYSQPWAGGEKGVWTLTLHLTAQWAPLPDR